MPFAVCLDVFEGPLDLLLQLVSRQRVDIAQVSISAITDDYLRAVGELEEVDLSELSSFLVLAATLLELKAARLVPREGPAAPDLAELLEQRDLLLHRLIEYATFKNAAAAFGEMLRRNEGFHVREAGPADDLLPDEPEPVDEIDPARLASAASRALRPRPAQRVDTSFVAPIRVSVSDAIRILKQELQVRRAASFRELCRSVETRIEMIVRFLALLELLKQESVEIDQPEVFGEIVVRWREPAGGCR